jgi:hypothetical protein
MTIPDDWGFDKNISLPYRATESLSEKENGQETGEIENGAPSNGVGQEARGVDGISSDPGAQEES